MHFLAVGECVSSLPGFHRRIVAVVVLGLLATTAQAQPSTPAHTVLPATETARTTVVGRVEEVTKLDRSGYAATVLVERVLAGDAKPGGPVRIGWEELSSKRPPRLSRGQRVLIVLEDLPQASLWRQRFPPPTQALAIAAHGDAIVVDPNDGDLALIAPYAQLGAAATSGARANALARIAAGASPTIAGGAVARLASLPNAGAGLDATAVDELMRTAADADQPLPLRRDIILFAGGARLTAAVPQLEIQAKQGAVLEAEALAALGEIRGLPSAQVEALLDRPEPALRAVGARFATGAVAERRLPSMARLDPAPTVRAAAAQALAGTRTVWGLDGAVPALADPDPQVRSAAAHALGALGASGVPALVAVARTQPAEARGAITALSLAGPQGVAAVRQLAHDHPDERLRDFARLALGQGPHAH